MATSNISFKVSHGDAALIDKIIDRALASAKKNGFECDRLDLEMDITATHANGNPLRLHDLLNADDLNFAHDVWGIRSKIDRTTGKLTDHFSPRYSA